MKKILQTPIKDEDLEALNIGDVVYLTGTLVTCRDVAHRRLIELGRELPVDLKGGAIFHAGPIVRQRKMANTKWFPLDQQHPCAWKSLKRNLSNKQALS